MPADLQNPVPIHAKVRFCRHVLGDPQTLRFVQDRF